MHNRLESLDWLRGSMALSILLYHLGGPHDASTPLGKLAVYGVSIFFILSGLSMAIGYDKYIRDMRSSRSACAASSGYGPCSGWRSPWWPFRPTSTGSPTASP
jgi:peptidoglycan/LPS O-acetylase OafA/YrhL